MANTKITIPLDAKTARAYAAARPAEKRKIRALLSLWLRELAAEKYTSLERVLDEVGRKAKARGLTAEKLESLLKGA
jgi:hypothetical protein